MDNLQDRIPPAKKKKKRQENKFGGLFLNLLGHFTILCFGKKYLILM